ncbi:MAG: dihydropteroate synthase, partial [Gammaproteobacteria bacterium]|nr:dihydropteroate synthase [Gammaproteobacteria bacterium]
MLLCGRFSLPLDRPLIMGIVNVTPDSFFDGGRHASPSAGIEHALRLLEEGADILDVGGESSRPGALSVSIDEELRRVMPVVEAMRGRDVPVSVDTCKAEVMRAAIESGAAMINDIDALQNEGALAAVAGSNVAVCLIEENRDKIELMAKTLLEWETIDADQISDIMEGRAPRPPKPS